MTKIYIIRHGETEWNRLTKLQGREDIELNATGRLQAGAVSAYFKGLDIDHIYTSPLKRAYETAQIIAEHIAIKDIGVENHLIERDYGLASGYTASARKEIFPDGKYPGVEDTEKVTERMMTAIMEIGRINPDSNIVLVSHGSAINTVLSALTEGEIGSGKTNLHTCCVNLLHYEKDELAIEFYNKKVYA